MSAPLLALVALIYLGVAVSEYNAGHSAMCLVWSGYAFANVGFIWQTLV